MSSQPPPKSCAPRFLTNSTILDNNAPLNVFSIIRKFEALSTHAGKTPLQQSPVRTPRSLLRNKATSGASEGQEAVILSPTRTGMSYHSAGSSVKDKIRLFENCRVSCPGKSTLPSLSSRRTLDFRDRVAKPPLNHTPPSTPSMYTGSHSASVRKNGDFRYITTKSDTTPSRKRCSANGVSNSAAEMIPQGTRVRVLHNVVAWYENKMPGNGSHESGNHRTSNANAEARHSASKLRSKLDFWEGLSRGQENPRQLSSKRVVLNVVADATPAPVHINGEINSRTSPLRQRSRNNGRAIATRIKLFQRRVESPTTKRAKVNNHVSEQSSLRTQRQRVAEDVGKGNDTPNLFAKGLTVKDIGNIMKEFHEIETRGVLKRRETTIGRRRTLMGPNLSSTRRLVGMRDSKIDGPPGDIKEMIVREADCGLKEPKPLRLAETRRIIWMCREELGPQQVRQRAISEPLRW